MFKPTLVLMQTEPKPKWKRECENETGDCEPILVPITDWATAQVERGCENEIVDCKPILVPITDWAKAQVKRKGRLSGNRGAEKRCFLGFGPAGPVLFPLPSSGTLRGSPNFQIISTFFSAS